MNSELRTKILSKSSYGQLTELKKYALLSKYKHLIHRAGTLITRGGPTADEVTKNLDLKQKTCLITGGTSGIGIKIFQSLMARGCNVVMACRNRYAARRVVQDFGRGNSNASKIYDVNLGSMESVRRCSEKLIQEQQKLDIVILNAAVFGVPWTLTRDGMETIFQVNYLSQVYLLLNIEKILAPNGRVIFVSGSSHRNVNMNLRDPDMLTKDDVCLSESQYTSIKAYNLSKLCGVLAMNYLNSKWKENNIDVYCAHPGTFVKTGLCMNWWPYEALYTIMKPFTKTISQAASTPLVCATSACGGGYWSGGQRSVESELAADARLAAALHRLTLQLIADCTAPVKSS